MKHEKKPYLRRVHYYETDQMGIVHHANHVRWFEEARIDFMDQWGLPYAELEKDGIWMPVTHVDVAYLLPLTFGETAEIVTSLVSFNGIRAVFRYEIYTEKERKLAVKGESGHCFLDAVSKRPLNLQKRRPDFYAAAQSRFAGFAGNEEKQGTGKRRRT
ncbi:MAG TPA: acyl-CoA thioesterase [Clostridiales bacterium]|nr:acyl-CoA thioesterase [Clostridiales bacterium]